MTYMCQVTPVEVIARFDGVLWSDLIDQVVAARQAGYVTYVTAPARGVRGLLMTHWPR